MKYLFVLAFLWLAPGLLAQSNWSKYYYEENAPITPTAIKSYNDGVYLASTVERTTPGGAELRGVFSKFDPLTGNLLWHFELNFASFINDFIYVPEDDAFILVCRYEPFDPFLDGATFLLKIDDNGTIINELAINQNGRENLSKIVRQPANTDTIYQYYIVGVSTPVGPSNEGRDLTVLFNISADLDINWRKEYPALDGQEIEGARGLMALNGGGLLMLGNDIKWNNTNPDFANNNGTVIQVDNNGNNPKAHYFPGEIDWWDGVQVSNTQVILAGHKFGINEGYLGLYSLQTNGFEFGLQFPELEAIRSISVSDIGPERVRDIYFTAKHKGVNPPQNLLMKLAYQPLNPIRFVLEHISFID
ncbi:MAG: hypothetical protein AAFQ37_06285, partial [Bacteroidota bacterium]